MISSKPNNRIIPSSMFVYESHSGFDVFHQTLQDAGTVSQNSIGSFSRLMPPVFLCMTSLNMVYMLLR